MSEFNNAQQEEYSRLINKSEDYIEAHLDDIISLEDLANHANFSSYHFHRLFKEYSRETLKQFVTRIKMERAALFLSINQSISLTEVALNYGYSDVSSFSRAFKRYFGRSPSHYRREQEMTRKKTEKLS
ncbi:helix-turn-helix domain-containing protein [Vagococcus fluvialis]|uniref:helix-turn-helix domain-containing protein n=1 Tax=Vagococcus fluvialis TaxID=2738 RepID=UPI003B5B4E37